jgi:hypothetical protein
LTSDTFIVVFHEQLASVEIRETAAIMAVEYDAVLFFSLVCDIDVD